MRSHYKLCIATKTMKPPTLKLRPVGGMPSAKWPQSTIASGAAQDQSVASASVMRPAVHFLAMLLTPGALGGTCPPNFRQYWSYSTYEQDVCYPCVGNTSSSAGATRCTKCPSGKWVPPEILSRRRSCSPSDCSYNRRRRRSSTCYSSVCGTADSRTACVPLTCPEGHKLKGYNCVPVLAYALEHVPTPKLQALPDSYGLVSIRVEMFLPKETYENITVVGSLDLKPNASALAPKNLCDPMGSSMPWNYTSITSANATYTAYRAVRVFSYPELDGPCKLDSTLNATGGTRSGVVGVFASRELASGNYQVLRA